MDDSEDYDEGFSAGYDEGYEEGYERGYADAHDERNVRLTVLARPLVILAGVCMLAGLGVLVLIILKVLPWSSRWWGYGLLAGGVLWIWVVGYVLPALS